MLCDRQEPATQYPSTSGSNIVGDILYNLAVSNEEGHSRQYILAFAANRYGLDQFSTDSMDSLWTRWILYRLDGFSVDSMDSLWT